MTYNNIKFEEFKDAGSRFSYTISLNKAGGFSFNTGFYKNHNIDKFDYVKLYYSRKPKAVGFSFLKEQEEGAFKISHINQKTASVRPNSFIAVYNIDYVNCFGKYKPEVHISKNKEKIFYIVLEKK